jgi:hypothetical protein
MVLVYEKLESHFRSNPQHAFPSRAQGSLKQTLERTWRFVVYPAHPGEACSLHAWAQRSKLVLALRRMDRGCRAKIVELAVAVKVRVEQELAVAVAREARAEVDSYVNHTAF